MDFYDGVNGAYVGVFFRYGMVSGLQKWGLVLFQGMGMEFEDKIVLKGCRKGCCEYDPARRILCWVYVVLGKLYLRRLSSLIDGKVDSRTGNR